MRDAAAKARVFVEGRSREDLERDDMLAYAVVHAIQIVGEAVSRVTPETRGLQPAIVWKDIIGMRQRIVHDYEQLNLDIVWQVVTTDLAVLIVQLEAFLPPPSDDRNNQGGVQ
jgi:uncharacterized protein with HEPN domain